MEEVDYSMVGNLGQAKPKTYKPSGAAKPRKFIGGAIMAERIIVPLAVRVGKIIKNDRRVNYVQ